MPQCNLKHEIKIKSTMQKHPLEPIVLLPMNRNPEAQLKFCLTLFCNPKSFLAPYNPAIHS